MTNKQLYRALALKKLQSIKQRPHYQKDRFINNLLYEIVKNHNAKSIMLYLPLGIEADIMPLIGQLRRDKRELFVPFMEAESFRLVKYRMPLEKKKFGIKEPKNSKQYRNRVIDISIVPIVGTDQSFRRIGFGRGMYDRFFERERKNIKKVVFVSRELFISPVVITDHYDIRADLIVSANTILIRDKRAENIH